MCMSLLLSKHKQWFCTLILGGACQIAERGVHDSGQNVFPGSSQDRGLEADI